MRKSLHHLDHLNEIKFRIAQLRPQSKNKWGKMNAAQMFCHCDKILKIATQELEISHVNLFVKIIGMTTKYEMWIFNNGIPKNMPTFTSMRAPEICDFHESRLKLLLTIDLFIEFSKQNKLPKKHPLFGKMSHKDWGFLEYKHLHHHLKQFGK